MAFDQDIQDYMNASNQAVDLAYQGQWEKIADKIRRHYADRGLAGGGDLARVLAEAQQKFTDTINAKKQGMLAEAFRLQASRKQQQDQFRWYEEQQRQAYADQNSYMNRMATGAAMGGYGSQWSTHDARSAAFDKENNPYGSINGRTIYNPANSIYSDQYAARYGRPASSTSFSDSWQTYFDRTPFSYSQVGLSNPTMANGAQYDDFSMAGRYNPLLASPAGQQGDYQSWYNAQWGE